MGIGIHRHPSKLPGEIMKPNLHHSEGLAIGKFLPGGKGAEQKY